MIAFSLGFIISLCLPQFFDGKFSKQGKKGELYKSVLPLYTKTQKATKVLTPFILCPYQKGSFLAPFRKPHLMPVGQIRILHHKNGEWTRQLLVMPTSYM